MESAVEYCETHIRWFFVLVGAAAAVVGGLFTATIVGAIIGIPLMLVAFSLLNDPVERVPYTAV